MDVFKKEITLKSRYRQHFAIQTSFSSSSQLVALIIYCNNEKNGQNGQIHSDKVYFYNTLTACNTIHKTNDRQLQNNKWKSTDKRCPRSW